MSEDRVMGALVELINNPNLIQGNPHRAAAYLKFLQTSGEPFMQLATDEVYNQPVSRTEQAIYQVSRLMRKLRIPIVKLRLDLLMYLMVRFILQRYRPITATKI